MSAKEKLIKKIETYPVRKDVTFAELVNYLKYFGYNENRVSGSHHIFVGPNGSSIVLKDANQWKHLTLKPQLTQFIICNEEEIYGVSY